VPGPPSLLQLILRLDIASYIMYTFRANQQVHPSLQTLRLCVAPNSSSLHMHVDITSYLLLFKKLMVLPNVDLDMHINMVFTKPSNKYSTLNYYLINKIMY